MSTTLRERAREVKTAGEAQRGVFTPPPLIQSVYDYWLENTNSTKGRQIRHGSRKENFCHFWRVVMFWAPLRALGEVAEKVAPYALAAVALGGLAALVWAMFTVPDFWMGAAFAALGCVAVVVGILGMMSGVALANTAEARLIYDLPKGRFMWTFAILGAPLTIPAYLITKVIKGLEWAFRVHPKRSWMVALGGISTFFLSSITLAGGIGALLLTLGILVAIAGIVVAGFFGADYINGKRALEAKEFEEFKTAYREEYGADYVAPVRRPSLTKRFFRGVGDVLIFAAQVIRVKKWGICPLVDLER